ncbi:MAG: Protein YiiM [Pseudomonadales bacterium]|nr:Protein YiiM [Pseudomonadales bacterium]
MSAAAPVVLRELRAGRSAPFGPGAVRSAIDKQRVGAGVVDVNGLHGDEQADTRHHGGEQKALHHYAAEHYALWRAWLPAQAARFVPGAFGENLVTIGMTEDRVCVGDVYRLGGTTLQVSQGRQPCWKLSRRFGVPDMARRVQDSGLTGWYYRVLEPGALAAGDRFVLRERPHPDWTLARLQGVLYHDCLNREALAAIAALAALSDGWRALASQRLDSGVVEDWSRRLATPA